MASGGAGGIEKLVAGPLGEPTPARPSRHTRPAHAEDPTLNGRLEQMVEQRPGARQLSTHPGVGPLTALAFELVIGTPERCACAKQIASYLGLVPAEESSGDRRRLGHTASRAM